MSLSDRQVKIGSYLGIKPISHGEIYTFQIAVSDAETINIPAERRELLEQTLREHRSNLVSLVVRRTEAYDEEKEYEIVYGADWCIIAQELDIERLWVWVFDLTDEDAVAMKLEMEKLVGGSISPLSPQHPTPDVTSPDIIELKSCIRKLEKSFQEQINHVNQKLEQLNLTRSQAESNPQFWERLEQLLDQKLQLSKINLIADSPSQVPNSNMSRSELDIIAKKMNIKGRSRMNKEQLMTAILKAENINSSNPIYP